MAALPILIFIALFIIVAVGAVMIRHKRRRTGPPEKITKHVVYSNPGMHHDPPTPDQELDREVNEGLRNG